MSEINFRKRFRFNTEIPANEVHNKVLEIIKENNADQLVYVKISDSHYVLKFPKKMRKFFTPQMDITTELNIEKTKVRCLIGPEPIVWTGFAFIYGSMAILALFSTLIWGSNFMLNKQSLMYVPALVSLTIALGLFTSVKVAQHYTKSEMLLLKNFLNKALNCDCLKLADQTN